MTRPIYILLGVFILAIGVAGISHFPKGGRMLKQIDELKVRITSTTQIPEPTYIVSTGDWYFLDHISGGLAGYDAQKKSFTQVYAESWSTLPNGAHVFKIKSGIKFHDGTPITAQDIIWRTNSLSAPGRCWVQEPRRTRSMPRWRRLSPSTHADSSSTTPAAATWSMRPTRA